MENFHTSNITETREPGAATKITPPLPPPPVTHSPSKSLTLQPIVDFHLYATAAPLLPTSNLTSLPGGQFSNLVPQKQNLSKTKKRRSTKRKIIDKICAECGVTYNISRDEELKNQKNINGLVVKGTNVNLGDTRVLALLLRTLKINFYVQSTKIEIY